MEMIVATLVVFAVMTLAMSVGVLFGGRPLKGSCGGLSGGCPCSDEKKKACASKRMEGD